MTDEHNKPNVEDIKMFAEVLRFYHDSGVTHTLNDDLHPDDTLSPANFEKSSVVPDRAKTRESQEIVLNKTSNKKGSSNANMLQWVEEARKAAANSANLAELRAAVCAFEGCEIKKAAVNTVFSDGNPKSKIMLIGEAPGSTEDREGIPFCGASGQLLDKMFAAINLNRSSNIYISNTVFWRPPGNRKPTDFELEVCRPFVERHISLVDPDVVVMVGSTACYSLLQTPDNISRLRGKFYEYTNSFLSRSITAMVIFHPAYLLRQPQQKRLAWEDLKMLRAYIETHKIQVNT